MTAVDPRSGLKPTNPLRTILSAGLLAGILDGLDAVVFIGMMSGIPVARVFQFIASGLLGSPAFRGGLTTAFVGVVIHFAIAITVAAFYFMLASKLPLLPRTPVLSGIVYGLGVFAFMHYVVVPLTAAPKQPPASPGSLANLIFSHTLFVGIPIALITGRSARRQES